MAILPQEGQVGAAAPGQPADARQPSASLNLASGSFGRQAAAAPTAILTPAPAAIVWLQNHRSTTLWATPDSTAAAVRQVPQWSHLGPLGPSSPQRLLVQEPGDGVSRLPARGWVDALDVGPTGPPPVEWELAVSPQGPKAPRWQGETWPQHVTAELAAVVDGESGQVLYGKNARARAAPASLTKIATAVVALESGQLWEEVQVAVNASAMPDSTVMGLSPGERVSLKTLLYGLMLPSGNDAAVAIGQHVAGSEERFVELMNQLAARLGLSDTHFVNPHGLDAPGQYSSPYDMATLSRYAMRNPAFAALAGAKLYEAEGYRLANLNQLLWRYEGADGVKPGYTDLAGRALVGSASRNGARVFVALMRSQDLWGDGIGLLNYAFGSFHWEGSAAGEQISYPR